MLERFKAWLKTRDATTPCAIMPGDVMHLYADCVIKREFVIEGEHYPVIYDTDYDFEWQVTRPYRTYKDAVKACIATMNIEHVQKQDWI